MQFYAEFLDRSVNDILVDKHFKLISASENETVAQVIVKLRNNAITSVPVFTISNTVVTIDMLDLITFVAYKMGYAQPDPVSSTRAAKEFLCKSIKEVIEISGRNQFISIKNTSKIQDLLYMLSSRDVHRVGVVDEKNKSVGLITQSDIMKYIEANEGKLYAKLNQKVQEIWQMEPKKVESIPSDHFVIDALVKLVEKRISGIAIVDEEGKVVGNISASDLKRMQLNPPEQLCYDIYEQLQQFIHIANKGKSNGVVNPFEPVVVKPNDTLGQIIHTINARYVHRVYIVDDHGKPTGEISLCDIITQFRGSQSD